MKEREPRIVIFEEAPGIPDDGVMSIPDTFPCKAPAKSVLAARVNASDLTSCTAYPNAFFSREIPIAVTTTSSSFWASAFNTTLKFGLITTSCVCIPIYEICKVFAELGTFDKLKLPSTSVIVPRVVPFTNTEAPTTGCPSSSEITTPVTF